MWQLYDALIQDIPDELTVSEACIGRIWSSVSTQNSLGVAMTVDGATRPFLNSKTLAGQKLKTVAESVKSWNFTEATLGMAAINAWYNSPAHLQKLNYIQGDTAMERDAFLTHQKAVTGKKVATIGHFPFMETRFKPICQLSILERLPKDGDFPDSACEYILQEQDFVFITGVTFTNKTLPRLLELSKNAKVVLVGPSVPMAPVLFQHGIYCLEGFVVNNIPACATAIKEGKDNPLFNFGTMITLDA